MSQRVQVVPGGYSKGANNRSHAYDDPQVSRTIARLRQKLVNLEDLQPGSLMKSDVHRYFVKPKFGRALEEGDQKLRALYGTPKQVGSRQVGSTQYTWFINAATTRVCDSLILAAANKMFGTTGSKFGAKVIEGAQKYKGKDGVPGYLKKRYSKAITTVWMYDRPRTIQNVFDLQTAANIFAMPGVEEDYRDALNAFRSGKSVAEYRNHQRGSPSFGISALATAMNKGENNFEVEAPSTASSSSQQ